MAEPVVRVQGVTKAYVADEDSPSALDDVTLTIDQGELVAIMGQSGSGKTTLLNLIGGLDRAYSGTVEVLGHDLSKLRDSQLSRLRNESIGFIFQSYHLLPQLSCAENVRLPILFRSKAVEDVEKKIDAALLKVGLTEKKREPPSSLSGGQKQRVAIARALLLQPKLLLCDEPTGNLDQKTGDDIMSTLEELCRSEGLTIVIVTHEGHIAERCDRIIRLRDGRVLDREASA
jgi:putative ABC transport system ATP-binding protein